MDLNEERARSAAHYAREYARAWREYPVARPDEGASRRRCCCPWGSTFPSLAHPPEPIEDGPPLRQHLAPVGLDDAEHAEEIERLEAPGDAFATVDHWDELDFVLRHLSAREREVVARRVLLEETAHETGRALGLSANCVSQILIRTLFRVRRLVLGRGLGRGPGRTGRESMVRAGATRQPAPTAARTPTARSTPTP